MKNIYGNNSRSEGLKRNSLSGNVSPINAFIERNRYYHSPKSPIFDPYASSDDMSPENVDSSLIMYLQSAARIGSRQYRDSSNSSGTSIGSRGGLSARSSFSAIENMEMAPTRSRSPSVFWTPLMKGEDDVLDGLLVMDDVLVGSVAGTRMRCSPSSSKSNSCGSSSSGSNKSSNKKELCRSWEDSGICRYGTKCQFSHGKENLRPTRLPHKSKPELCKTYTGPGSCSYGSKCRFLHYESSATPSPSATLTTTPTISPIKLEHPSSNTMIISNNDWPPQNLNTTASHSTVLKTTRTTSPVKLEHPRSSSMLTGNKDWFPLDLSTAASPSATFTTTRSISPIKQENPSSSTMITAGTDWSPLDDGIEVNLPSSVTADKVTTREELDAYINNILYGRTGRKRLPVFVAICPE